MKRKKTPKPSTHPCESFPHGELSGLESATDFEAMIQQEIARNKKAREALEKERSQRKKRNRFVRHIAWILEKAAEAWAARELKRRIR